MPKNKRTYARIDASVPADTPAHMRDWLKAIADGEHWSSDAQAGTKAAPPPARRRRPKAAKAGVA